MRGLAANCLVVCSNRAALISDVVGQCFVPVVCLCFNIAPLSQRNAADRGRLMSSWLVHVGLDSAQFINSYK